MSIKIDWFDADKAIIRWEVSSDFLADDLFTAQNNSRAMADALENVNRVDLVVLLPPDINVPKGIFGILSAGMKRAQRIGQAKGRFGISVLVGANGYGHTILETFFKLTPLGHSWRIAETVEEAIAMIEKDRIA